MSIERSIYEMLQLVSISLTETICLKDLFAKPNCLNFLITSPEFYRTRVKKSYGYTPAEGFLSSVQDDPDAFFVIKAVR